MIIDISKFDQCNILIIGDLILDEYLCGKVDRISPEAPVQIVDIQKEDFVLGGACNVANNIITLGGNVYIAGVIGNDKTSELLFDILNRVDIDTTGIIKEDNRVTTKKTRIIAANQHVLRIDRETRKDISVISLEKIIEFIKDKIQNTDIILISDYGKGVVTKDLLKAVTTLSKKFNKTIIADPKGLDFSKYSGVSILTPNKKEASLASGIEILNKESIKKAAQKIMQLTDINNILITCGKDGMSFFEKGGKEIEVKAEAKQVFDVSGAGDTVLALLGLCLASDISIYESLIIANIAAGIVVGKVGTATVSKQELILFLSNM